MHRLVGVSQCRLTCLPMLLAKNLLAANDVDALLHLLDALAGKVEDGVIDH